jgi:molybdenum cofactor cytidylyltransferase
MKLADFATADCLGLVLAHRQTSGSGNLKKGTILTAAMVAQLQKDGVTSLICAKPEDGDIHEDVAAERLARALSPTTVTFTRAATGRVNICTLQRGIIRYDRALIRQLNEIDEAITFALVQHNQLLDAGQMAATLKIIPFFVAESSIIAVENLFVDRVAFSFHALRQCNFGLIQTRLAGQKDRLFSATQKVTEARLAQLGSQLVDSRICAHDRSVVAAEMRQAVAAGAEIILVCGGSAIIDRQDELPQALVLAGGEIDQFGLAVDPGNLLMVGKLGSDLGTHHVIGMPGCARSPKLNGLDWVLQLVLADIPLRRGELAEMAAGGLLMEIASRPMPRALAISPHAEDKMAAILLAAGQSRRMGTVNKLLAPIAGKPLVRHAAETLVDVGLSPLIVVIGHEADKVASALDGLPVQLVFNPDHAQGQASSVGVGVAALEADITDLLIALGDMPLLSTSLLEKLVQNHLDRDDHHRCITLPTSDGKRGNPVLWGKAFFPELAVMTGDSGGRQLLDDHQAVQNLVPCDDSAILRDVDTADALAVMMREMATDHANDKERPESQG